jgi:hypothetical protein
MPTFKLKPDYGVVYYNGKKLLLDKKQGTASDFPGDKRLEEISDVEALFLKDIPFPIPEGYVVSLKTDGTVDYRTPIIGEFFVPDWTYEKRDGLDRNYKPSNICCETMHHQNGGPYPYLRRIIVLKKPVKNSRENSWTYSDSTCGTKIFVPSPYEPTGDYEPTGEFRVPKEISVERYEPYIGKSCGRVCTCRPTSDTGPRWILKKIEPQFTVEVGKFYLIDGKPYKLIATPIGTFKFICIKGDEEMASAWTSLNDIPNALKGRLVLLENWEFTWGDSRGLSYKLDNTGTSVLKTGC